MNGGTHSDWLICSKSCRCVEQNHEVDQCWVKVVCSCVRFGFESRRLTAVAAAGEGSLLDEAWSMKKSYPRAKLLNDDR